MECLVVGKIISISLYTRDKICKRENTTLIYCAEKNTLPKKKNTNDVSLCVITDMDKVKYVCVSESPSFKYL